MTHHIRDTGIARYIGSYSDAIETEPNLRWLYTSGTPGITEDGRIPEGIEAQTRQAWKNVFAALDKAGMTTADLVKVTTTLINTADIPGYVKIRKEMLADVKPAFMLQVITQLVKPELLVEIEVVAARR